MALATIDRRSPWWRWGMPPPFKSGGPPVRSAPLGVEHNEVVSVGTGVIPAAFDKPLADVADILLAAMKCETGSLQPWRSVSCLKPLSLIWTARF
jgi:hypothetical protein